MEANRQETYCCKDFHDGKTICATDHNKLLISTNAFVLFQGCSFSISNCIRGIGMSSLTHRTIHRSVWSCNRVSVVLAEYPSDRLWENGGLWRGSHGGFWQVCRCGRHVQHSARHGAEAAGLGTPHPFHGELWALVFMLIHLQFVHCSQSCHHSFLFKILSVRGHFKFAMVVLAVDVIKDTVLVVVYILIVVLEMAGAVLVLIAQLGCM